MAGEADALLSLPADIAAAVRSVLEEVGAGRATGTSGGLTALPKSIATSVGDVMRSTLGISARPLTAASIAGGAVGGMAGKMTGDVSMGVVAPKLATVIAPFEAFVSKFVKSITDVLGPFQRMTDLASHFVEFFDPALVADLGRHFRDLNAVLGVALRPIVDVARDVVKSLSSYLLPAMRELEPMVREIADVVGDQLMEGFRDLGAFLHALMPTFREGKDLLIGLVRIISDLRPLVEILGSVVMQLIREIMSSLGLGGGSMKEMMADLRRAIQDVIAAIVQFAASLLGALGWTRGIEAMRKALTTRAEVPKADATGMAVLLNPMFRSISDMGKSMQAAMFAASAAGTKEKKTPQEETNEFLGKLLDAVNAGAGQADKTKTMINDYLEKFEKFLDDTNDNIKDIRKWYTDKKAELDKLFTDVSTVADAAASATNRFSKGVNRVQSFGRNVATGLIGPVGRAVIGSRD